VSWVEHLRPEIAALSPFRPTGRDAPVDLVRLDCNEAPIALDPSELEALRTVLGTLSLQRYPELSGASLRRTLAERWQIDPAQILLGNGSSELLALLATAFGGGRHGRRARLLYPDPSFPHYEVIARTHGLVPVAVPLESDFRLDEQRIAQAIAAHTPALALVASPNNPSGNRFEPDALLRLARRMDAAFVADEAYVDFVDGGAAASTLIPRVREIPGLFVTRTFSKLGFAGLRVGALIGAPDAIAELDKVRLPWNVNAASLAFAEALLSRPERIDARVRMIRELRSAFEMALHAIPGLHVFPSQANFVLVRVALSAQLVFERLLAHGILVKNVARPGVLDGCLRITVGTATENQRCASALREALAAGRGAHHVRARS
jgi:histidinol-phosphate aminotransferase